MNAYAEIDNAVKRLANRKGNPYNDLAAHVTRTAHFADGCVASASSITVSAVPTQ